MVPAVTNNQLADSHLEIICTVVSPRLLGICKKLNSVSFGKRLRKAMIWVRPGRSFNLADHILDIVIHLRLTKTPNTRSKRTLP